MGRDIDRGARRAHRRYRAIVRLLYPVYRRTDGREVEDDGVVRRPSIYAAANAIETWATVTAWRSGAFPGGDRHPYAPAWLEALEQFVTIARAGLRDRAERAVGR